MSKDKELALQIYEKLTHDSRVSARAIHVTAKHGIVTLRGSPQSYRRILAAIETAICFKGCRGIINGLRVRAVGRMEDDEITNFVRAVLEAHRLIRRETMTITVRGGEVTH